MKTKHPESLSLPEAERNIIRQYDEILCRRIELRTPWTFSKLSERTLRNNIGKLYVDMQLKDIPQKDDAKLKNDITAAGLIKEHIQEQVKNCLAVKINNGDNSIYRFIDIDYNSFQDVDSSKLDEAIRNREIAIVYSDKGLLLSSKTDLIKGEIHVLNITIDNKRNHTLHGMFEYNCSQVEDDVNEYESYVKNKYNYKAVILKKLEHSRTGEIFYKIYVINALDPNDKGIFLCVSDKTLFNWDKSRLVDILLPEKFQDIDPEDVLDIDTFDEDEESLDIEMDDFENNDGRIVSNYTVLDDVSDDMNGYTADYGYKAAGVGYKQGQAELASIIGEDPSGYQLNPEKLQIDFDDQIYSKAVSDEILSGAQSAIRLPDYESAQNSQNEVYRLKVEKVQPLEEYFEQCLGSDILEKQASSEKLENNFVLRLYEENANKITEQVIDSGLFDISDFPKNLKSSLLIQIKKETFEFCEGLYPPGIELSLVDMLQVYRVIVPYFFNRSRRYINYLRQCYSSDGMQCNIKKRDNFMKAVPISVFNQIDMNSKKDPDKFVNTSCNIEYSLEGETYKINFLAKCALTGFEQCFKGLALGNRFQEEPDMRKQFMINKTAKKKAEAK